MRVRGCHPFQPVVSTIPDDIPWQDWILSNHMIDNASNSFKRDRLPNHNNFSAQAQLPFDPTMTSADGASSSQRTLALNADVIADILAATRVMPSWKACQVGARAGLARRKKTSRNMSLLLAHKIVDLLDFIPLDLRGSRESNLDTRWLGAQRDAGIGSRPGRAAMANVGVQYNKLLYSTSERRAPRAGVQNQTHLPDPEVELQ
jgi:hypothetical protein